MTIETGAGIKWWFNGQPFVTTIPQAGYTLGTQKYWFNGLPFSAFSSGTSSIVPSTLFLDTDTFFAPTVGVDQFLTAGLVTDTDTFFTPAVSPANLFASLYDDTDTFFAPTATAGSVTLTAVLFDDTDTFFAPTVSAGAVTLTAALFTDTDTFFAPTVEAHGSVAPGFVIDTDTFFAPTVVPGAVSLLPGLATDTDMFFAPTVDARASMLPGLVTDTDTFFAPTVVPGAITLLPTQFVDTDTIFVISAPNTSLLDAPFVDSDAVIYSPIVTTPSTLLPAFFSDADVLFSPTLVPGPVSVLPSRVIDLDIFLTANVGNVKNNGQGGGNGGGNVPANLKYASQITMSESGLIFALEVEASTAKTINTRMVVYADNGSNLPGILLGQSAVKSSVVVGANNYPLLVPVSRTIGQKVWVALHSDGSFNWFLTPSSGGSKFNTDLFSDGPSDPFGPTSNENKKAPVFVLFLGAATAGMTAGLVTDTDEVFAPAISGSKTLTAPFLTDTDFFLSPSTLPENPLAPSLVSDEDTIYAPSATRSALLPGLIEDTDTFDSPFVGRGDGFVFGADMPSDDTIHQATVTSFGAGLPAPFFDDADTFFTPEVVVAYQLATVLYDDTDTFFVATVSRGSVTLEPELTTSGEDFYDPLVTRLLGTSEITPELFVDDATFYSPSNFGNKSGRRQVFLDGRNDSNKELAGT